MKRFLAAVKRDARARGVYLDAEQALVTLRLAQCARLNGRLGITAKEEDILRRFEKRCGELKP